MSAINLPNSSSPGRRRLILGLMLLAALGLGLTALARAEIAQKGDVRIAVNGKLSPTALPRHGEAPVRVTVSAKVSATGGGQPPAMRQLSIAVSKYGHLDTTGLPVCQLDQIQPSTTDDALAACRRSLIGQGTFLADVPESANAPFPSEGKIYAFNGESEGHPAILAHVYGVKPAPASYTMAFEITHSSGDYGTTLSATLPPVKLGSGAITGLSLSLGKNYTAKGRRRSLFSGSCPAPSGIHLVAFRFAKVRASFFDGPSLQTTLSRACTAKG
jgi:hypothetical protein